MKEKLITIASALALLLLPLQGWSQGATVVYDPTSFGGILKQIYTDIQNHADDLMMTEEQLSQMLSILETTQEVSSTMDRVYNDMQPVLSKTRILYTAGSSIQNDYRTLTETCEAYARLFQEGKISATQFNRALRKTNSLLRVVKDDYDIISTALSSAMSAKEKMDIMKDAENDSKLAAMEARAGFKEWTDSIMNADIAAARRKMLGSIMRCTPTRENSALKIEWDAAEAPEDEFADMDTDGAADRISTSNGALFNLVEIILGILFIISLAWGGVLYLKGDPQHQDALFKIALGLGFVVVVLEILKTVLY